MRGEVPSVGATEPTSCHRRPSPKSFVSKWVDRVGKLTGAHSQKNCGSATGAPEAAGSPTGRTPHERSRDRYTVSGVTSWRSPSTSIQPLHAPNWVKRV